MFQLPLSRPLCLICAFALSFAAPAQSQQSGAIAVPPQATDAAATDPMQADVPGDAEARAAEEATRLAAEEEAARIAAEAEAARAAAEAEAEAARIAAEEAIRQAAADAAVAACMDTAGPASADVPVSEAAQRAIFDRLRAALPACREALSLAPEAGGPLFHMATVAQATGEHREAVALYERAAQAGVGPAHTRLGDYYNFGIGPIRTDTDAAVAAYRAATDLGDPAGMATLAFMYRLGRGVSRDPARMVELFRLAADQGYHFAQVNLAQTYLTGEGFAGNADADLGIPDPREAVPLLAAAARSGNLDAALALAQLYADGAEGVPADPPSRFRWTDIAAEAGSPAAMAARAYLWERGIGTAADPDRAADGYVRALETGEVSVDNLRAAGGSRPPAWDRDTAIAFQIILQSRGLYDGAIDGIVGPGTLGGARGLDD